MAMTTIPVRLSLEEAAALASLEVAVVRYCAEAGLIAPAAGYGEAELAELRRVRRLIDDLELNMPAVEVMLRMRRRMLALQAELRRLELELRRAGRPMAARLLEDADWEEWL